MTEDDSLDRLEPKYATLPHWCVLSGMSRTKTYYAIGAGNLRAVKLGNRTLVDVDAGLAWLRSLPAAQIRISKVA